VTWSYRVATVMGRPVFRITNPDTGEIREFPSFTSLVEGYDEAWRVLGKVAEALGPEVFRRWQDGDESLDLAAELRKLAEEIRSLSLMIGLRGVGPLDGEGGFPRMAAINAGDRSRRP